MYEQQWRDPAPERLPQRSSDGSDRAVAVVRREPARPGPVRVRRRRTGGPRPVRPQAAVAPVRPAQAERPQAGSPRPVVGSPGAPRTLVRRPHPMRTAPVAAPARRWLGGVAVVVLAAAVVFGWGQLLAARSAQAPGPTSAPAASGPPAGAWLTVDAETTVWDVARGLEPAADGHRLSAVAERIARDNALTSVELRPGQVLRVPTS
jgi:hypothetical protein